MILFAAWQLIMIFVFASLWGDAILAEDVLPSPIPAPKTAFYLDKNPKLGPGRLGTQTVERSVVSCAANCFKDEDNCKTFMFNPMSHLCTLGSVLNKTESLPTSFEGDLYIKFIVCESVQNFHVLSYGSTSACIALFNQPKLSYLDADGACKTKGAHLMSVKTMEKLQILRSFVRPLAYSAWIGLDDMENDWMYVWKEDLEVMTLNQVKHLFGNYQPDHGGGHEYCVESRQSFNYYLNDATCTKIQAYVCEYCIPY